jgi:hypothetical protein
MPGFVTDYQQQILTGLYDTTFQTFARNIVIYKQPIKQQIITVTNNPNNFGFGDAPIENQYSFIPVSGVFLAVVRYPNRKKIGDTEVIQDTNTMAYVEEVRIKVRDDCYNFIESGQTDKFVFDNKDFYLNSKSEHFPFLGSSYYIYRLRAKQ